MEKLLGTSYLDMLLATELNTDNDQLPYIDSCAPKKAADNEVLHNPNAPLTQA
jgi:hypothetical protein